MFLPLARVALLPIVLLLGSCTSSGSEPNFRVSLTDAPAPAYTAVNVTIASVRVHQSASAGEAQAGWRDIPVTAAMPVDLLRLRGVLHELCGQDLPPGAYQQVRLVLAGNDGPQAPSRNSVTTADGLTHPLDVPGSAKISHGFAVADGTTTDLVLDFDAAKSLKQRGNGSFFLQPWITASSTVR